MQHTFHHKPFRHFIGLLVVIATLLGSCTRYNSIVNFNESVNYRMKEQSIDNFQPLTIQPADILQIKIASLEADAVDMFNNYQPEGYLVNSEGTIDFPLLGTLILKDKTMEEAKELLLDKLAPYFVKIPTVNVRLTNFSIMVTGEVNSPGSYKVGTERFSILEAITQAGDLTSYARRDSIMVIRESGGKRSFGYVDFNNAEVFTSPYFYLRQNDVIYVMPDKSRLGTIRDRESKYLPFISVGISLLILTLTVFNLR